MKKNLLLLFIVFINLVGLKAQQHNCSVPPAPAHLLKQYPATNNGLLSVPTFTIPTVFHIYYNGQSTLSPPGYADVQRALDTLNMRFAKTNPDTSLIYSGFKNIAADAQIKFQLARKDEAGNCISGIFYHYTSSPLNTSFASNLNTNMYLNIHLVLFVNGGFAGFANYPTPWSTTPDPGNDIVAINNGIFGNLLTHEAGHWLNLIHTFGNVNQTGVCGDDLVADTPETTGNSGCDTLLSVCNPPVIENTNNYMDYSTCTYMFTQGQVSRMQSTLLDTTLSRRIVWTPSNLSATGISPAPSCSFSMSPVAYQDFSKTCTFSPYYTFIAAPITQMPDSVKWTFPGGSPAVSYDAVETVSFATSTSITVTLDAWLSGVQYTYTVSITPAVTSSNGLTHTANFPYTQNFENNFSLPAPDLFVSAADTSWRITANGFNSDSSLYIPAEHKLQNDTNTFTFGTFALLNMVHPQLNFKVSTSHNSNTVYRKLFVYLRNRCTNAERLINIQYDSVMAGTNSAAGFVPASPADWKQVNINMSFVNSDSVRKEYELRFVLIKYFNGSVSDENIYIDNINISDTTGAAPVADFSIENIHFCQSGCYELECVDHSTGGPFAYSWGTFGGYPNNPVAKGCYYLAPFDTVMIYLTVYNEFGSSMVAKPVYIHTIFMDSVSVSPQPVCSGDTVDMHFYSYHHTLPNGESYLWTNTNTPTQPYSTLIDSAGAMVQATPSGNTTYNVHVQNDFGCTANFTKTVNVSPAPFISVTKNKTCIGTNDSVNFTAAGGPGYVYAWAPVNDLNVSTGPVVNASPDATTTYTLTVNDGLCSAQQTVSINVSAVFPQTNIIANDSVFCSGQSLMLHTSSNVPVTNTWSWNPCCLGTYTTYNDSMLCGFPFTTTVTITSVDTNGCSTSDTQVISQAAPPAFWVHPFNNTYAGGMQIILCSFVDSVCLMAQGAGNYTYTWSTSAPGASLSSGSGAQVTFHNPNFSMAPVTVTATNTDGCTAGYTYLINHQYQGNYPNFSLSPSSATLCENSSTTVNITPGGFGTNYYFWMPTNGVSGINSTGTNQSNVGNGSSAVITGTSSTTYTVTAIEVAYGCVASKLFTLTVDSAPPVNLGADTTLCSGDSILLDAQNSGNTFLWSTGSTAQSILVGVSGMYSVGVTGANGCVGSDTVNVNVSICTEHENAEVYNDFKIGTGINYFSLIPPDQDVYSFSLLDMSGRLFLRSEQVKGLVQMNTSVCPAGIYFLRIEKAAEQRTYKLVVSGKN